MQLIVEISEDTFFDLKKKQNRTEVDNAVLNGTPLPKGHGRLIDADDIRVIELEDSLHFMQYKKGDETDVYIDAPTIIEADKESEDKENKNADSN